jgi:hypothetical protein
MQSRTRGRKTRGAMGRDSEAEREPGDHVNLPDTADNEQQSNLPARQLVGQQTSNLTTKRMQSRTRGRKTRGAMGRDSEAEREPGNHVNLSDTADNEQQNNLPARLLVGQQTSASRPENLFQPGGMDPLVLLTPSPSPSPNQPTLPTRPKPRPKGNPSPSRIQPKRKGKVN